MGSFVTNVIKKKVKKLHQGYVKLRENKKSKKEGKIQECDKSGSYKAEPTEELYERLSLIPENRRCSGDITISTHRKTTQHSLPIPCSSKNSSNDSQEYLLESFRESNSPSSSLDSGISRTPPGSKKLKKLQFSSNSDEVHVFEPDTFEKKSCKQSCSNQTCVKAELCKAKVFEIPVAEKVKIINEEYNEDSVNQLRNENNLKANVSDSSNIAKQLPEIPFKRLRIKQSIVSPKIYHQTSKKNINSRCHNNFLGNFSQRIVQDTPPQKCPNSNFNKENWTPLSLSYQDSFKSFDKFNSTCNSLTPLLESPPEKPPRSAKDLKKIPVECSIIASQYKSGLNNTECTFLSNEIKTPLTDEDGYSIPFDMKKRLLPEMSSTPIKELSNGSAEHLYAKITQRSTSDVSSTASSTKSDHIYAQITPRSSRNMKQHSPPAEDKFQISLKETSPDNLNNSEKYFSCSQEVSSACDIKSVHANDVLSKECKDKLNMIHKTNWSLKMDNVVQGHDCHSKNKKPEELCLEEKFVVNIFESRPSKRWEKHIRDLDLQKDEDKKFDRNTLARLSLDSKKQKTKNIEANVQNINENFADIEKEIEILERESKSLEIVSKKIKRELKRMEEQDNDAYSKQLEKEKLRIENHLNKLNNNVDETSMKLTNESRRIESELEQIKSQSTEDYNNYKRLKKSRDVQCTRMTQASKVLEEIKNRRGKKDWLEILVAERTLLETSEKVKLLTQQIRDTTYTVIPEPPLHKGTIHLSDIKFPFAKQYRGNCKQEKHYTEFFVMTLSCGPQIFISEFVTGESDPLTFSRRLTFKDVAPDFEIKVKLFCLRLRTSDEYFWEKFTCYNLCKTSQIIYEDILTHQFQEKTVYKTSFKLCAENTLTNTNINGVSARLNTKPEIFCKLDSQFEFNLKCDDIDIVAKLSGFLDVGTLCGETYFWERKWCVLNGPNLMLYNYPQEEDFGKPFEQINLEYCFGPIVTKVDNCPKRRSFHLKTGRPNDIISESIEDAKVHTLKTKPNFTLRKFYFAASNMEEYLQWTVEVEKILNSLSDFKKLAFGEEYIEYLKK